MTNELNEKRRSGDDMVYPSQDLDHEGKNQNEREHLTRKVTTGIKRFAVEVVDDSLNGFGIESGDRVIIIADGTMQYGKLLMVQTQRGIVLRVADDCSCGENDIVLVSGNINYPVRGYRKIDITVLGYAPYFDRLNDKGQWEQFHVPENLKSIANAIHDAKRRDHC